MELFLAVCAVLTVFAFMETAAWLSERPKIKKRIGKRRWYVKWNREDF